MKNITFFLMIYLCLQIAGCDFVTDNKINRDYSVTVTGQDIVQSDADVMILFSDGLDSVLTTDEYGTAHISTEKSITMVIGMKLGFSGIKKCNVNEDNISVSLQQVEIPQIQQDWVGTFGVYSTNSDGDVTFRYQGNFRNYYCSSYLPYLGESTNPNNWGGWPLTEFTLPWKGKKLLVPRRYQVYHRTVYGFSISQALFLQSNI